MKVFIREHKESILLAAVFLFTLILRLSFLGSSLWHYDAFNFVDKAVKLAVDGDYVNAHSTGYPLWIILLAIGLKIGHLITGEWLIIFIPNLLTGIISAFIVVPVYRLCKYLLDNIFYAVIATLGVVLNPVIWRWSEIAMSDITALVLAVFAVLMFVNFANSGLKRYLYLSGFFVYLALMFRVLYGLLIPSLALFWITLNYSRFSFRRIAGIISVWISAIGLTFVTYAVFNNWSVSKILSNYGSALPTLREIFLAGDIILRSIGLFMVPPAVIGLFYIFKNRRVYAWLYVSIILFFWLYLSCWYRNGSFDIERYSLIATVMLLILSAGCLIGNKWAKYLFYASLIISGTVTIGGLTQKMDEYKTYVYEKNWLKDYTLKASQINQQKLIDAYVSYDQSIAGCVKEGSIVFHWGDDWSVPKLIIGGAHLKKNIEFLEVNSAQDIMNKLAIYKDKDIYLLRGAYKSCLEEPTCENLLQDTMCDNQFFNIKFIKR